MKSLSLSLFLLAAAPLHAETFVHLTAESGLVDYDIHRKDDRGDYTESSHRFPIAYKQGQRSTSDVTQVATLSTTATEHFAGRSAFTLQINAYTEPPRS